MFEITFLSCVSCLALYFFFRYAFIPALLSLSPKAKHYFYTSISKHEQQHHAQILVCFLHALVATQGSLRAVLPYHLDSKYTERFGSVVNIYENFLVTCNDYDPVGIAMQGKEMLELRHFYVEITIGYFIADTLIYLWYINQYPIVDLLHHVVSIASYITGLTSGVATFGMICLLTNEITTPFLHVRYFLSQWKIKGAIYQANQAIFAISFLICRAAYDSLVLYATYDGLAKLTTTAPPFPKYFQIASVTLFCLIQYFWSFKIISIAAGTLSKKKSTTSKNE